MIHKVKFIACTLVFGIITFIACKKELSCENCAVNKLRLANAGADQVAVLPKDSVLLDAAFPVMQKN
jgi:hypothetical protein